jgi:beta-lactamase regulating signal transducer with metallopeptidase domain/Tol biopolymer transport system component
MEAVMTYSQAFFGWLLQTTLIASLVICLILLIQKTLGGRLGPRWSHTLWLVLLIRMVLPWSPSSRVSLSNLIPSWKGQTQSLQSPGTIEVQEVSLHEQTTETSGAITSQEVESELVTQEQAASRPRTLVDAEARSVLRLVSLRRILPIIWLAGAIVIGVYLLISDLALWRIVKRDRPLLNQSMLELFEECKTKMGVQSLVVVVPSDQIKTPGLFGFVRPRLLMPREILDTATTEEMRYVFLHELAHLRRHDIYLGWLTSLLQVLHWFNPLIWFAFYRMRADRELACDALVLTRTGQDKSQEYGGAIVELIRHFSRSRRLPAMAGIIENKSQLKRRITMISQFKKNSYQWSPLAVVLIVMLGCVTVPGPKQDSRLRVPALGHYEGMVLRRILPEDGDFANVSPDGRYLCDTDPDTGNLAIRELTTGKRWPVTGKKTWDESDEYAEEAAISPDNRRVAYLWWNDTSDLPSLYVVNLDGSDCKLLCKDTYAMPRDWSVDGSKILAIVCGPPHRMVWISASDGSIQQIKDIGREYPGKFDISPDGRFIAYDLPQREGTKTRDVFLLDLRDNREIRLAEHPANDRSLGWTPNGKWILFASDRSEKWDAWLLGINDGVPSGPPRMVKANIGDVRAVGFASNGDYYFSIYDLRSNVYVAPFDIATGTLLSLPTLMQPTGKSGDQVWSQDGQHLAYSCCVNDEISLIKIWSLASGQERELNPKLPRCLFSWAPDSKSLILSGFLDEGWYNAVYKLDLETGECSEFLRHKDMSIAFAQWLPEGKRLLYHGHHGPNPARKQLGYLMIRDMDSGGEREITRGEFWRDYQWALSPDGRRLAVQFKNDDACVKIFSTEKDEVKEVLTGDLADKVFQTTWTPDGKAMMLRVLDFPAKRTSEIWRISVDGGKPEKLSEIDIPEYVTDMRIDPTGRHIALRAITNLHELWVMENFLPEDIDK